MPLKIEKVLISDKLDGSCKTILEQHGIQVDSKPGLSEEELKAIIKDYDGLIVRSATKVTANMLENATNMKIIGRAGTGVDNIDLNAATDHGVLVMNTPGGNTISAAEHTCALIAALSRNVGQAYSSMLQGKWERSKFMGCELMGKTLAIIGLGRIGIEVAHRMQSYGMKTIGFDPIVSKEQAALHDITHLPLHEIWPLADFVTVHTPLIKQTKGMINAEVFSNCKEGMKVVNVARGGIIDENDLLAALNSGKCGGAALDVFVSEPPAGLSLELAKHPKCLATPHLGASTAEAQQRVAKEIAEQFVDATKGKSMVGLVNAPALSDLYKPSRECWVEVATRLGRVVGMLEANVSQLNLEAAGDPLADWGNLLSFAFSYGLALSKGFPASLISGASLLKNNGIVITCSSAAIKECAAPSLSVSTPEGSTYTGVVSGHLPAISKLKGVDLVTPVAMSTNLLVGFSGTVTSNALIKLLDGAAITSMSTGVPGGSSVVVATVEGEVSLPSESVTFVPIGSTSNW